MRAITIRFSDKEHEGISYLSKDLERSMNDIVREAVRRMIEEEDKKQK